jgi:hypothetical protein
MSDTTLEEAKRCPRCQEPGLEVVLTRTPDGTVHTYQCENERCRWHQERWLVQVRPDGTIPDRTKDKGGRDKEFPAMTDSVLAMGQRQVEDAVQRDLRNQQEREP